MVGVVVVVVGTRGTLNLLEVEVGNWVEPQQHGAESHTISLSLSARTGRRNYHSSVMLFLLRRCLSSLRRPFLLRWVSWVFDGGVFVSDDCIELVLCDFS